MRISYKTVIAGEEPIQHSAIVIEPNRLRTIIIDPEAIYLDPMTATLAELVKCLLEDRPITLIKEIGGIGKLLNQKGK